MHGFHQENPRVVELKVGLYHGCSSNNHWSLEVMKLVMRFYQGCFIREKLCFKVKLVMGLHHLNRN